MAYWWCCHSSLRMRPRQSATGKARTRGSPARSTGVVVPASCSSVSPSTTVRMVAIRSAAAPAPRRATDARRGRAAPRGVGHVVVGQVERAPRNGSPSRARRIHASVAKTRWRCVSMKDHSPSTRSCSCSGGAPRARSKVPAHRRSRMSQASRNPAGSVGRILMRSGSRRSSSASTSGMTSTPLTRRLPMSPFISMSASSAPWMVTPVKSMSRKLGVVEVDVAERGAPQVDAFERAPAMSWVVRHPAILLTDGTCPPRMMRAGKQEQPACGPVGRGKPEPGGSPTRRYSR